MYFNKVLITGGAGFIGSHLLDKLCNISDVIYVIDNLSNGSMENIKGHLENEDVTFIKGDVKDIDNIIKDKNSFDIIFHYAANPEVRVSTTNPEIHFNENILASFKVLEYMRKKDIEYLVFASSSTVYGEAKVIPTPEDYHPLNPISVYGASKLAVENLITAYSNLYGLKALILRYANIIGPRSNHGVIIDFINKLKSNPHELEILGDGTQRKSYLHVYDAVDASLHLVNYFIESKDRLDTYNIGSMDWITVKEIADIIVEEMGLKNVRYKYKLTTKDGRGWPGDVKLMLLDISKLRRTGWNPKWDSRESVRMTARELLSSL
ncbi:UDP-glucose 4-epimerase [Candidatus Geothermarchaeota archaeon]|nr:MAG: UDP-glucose 4-epimerase [Candidatus Geothermarchaeota archaeon]